MTGRAGDIDVGQKLDVETDRASTVAVRAAQGTGVVRKVFGLVAMFYSIRRFGKAFSQFVVNAGIGRNGRADVDADGRGVNEFYLVDAAGVDAADMIGQRSVVGDGFLKRE